MRISVRFATTAIIVGLLGYVAVGVMWLRHGDLPTFYRTTSGAVGPEISSPEGIRSAHAEIRRLSSSGIFREQKTVVLLTISESRRGKSETWSLFSPQDTPLSLEELALHWITPHEVQISAFGVTISFQVAGAAGGAK
ncbi:MAG: hypothetical protein KA712_02585 [Myxococcales bacterium]|nr:hypothetical protein [Myxococcales bacterium]